jgi:hypothetical protein
MDVFLKDAHLPVQSVDQLAQSFIIKKKIKVSLRCTTLLYNSLMDMSTWS